MDTKVFCCDYTNPTHRQAIGMLINAYINDEMGGGNPLTEAEQTHLVEGLENHPKSVVFLAETDGIFCGLLIAFENFATFTVRPMLNIHDVIVLKTHRGKGIGRKLMRTLTAEAEKRGCSRITLEVRNDNYSAQNLYRSEGFEDAEPVHYYWRKYV
ncbi:MAG: GNAT family N-acetyltransferase [Dysgonamonadaceae bacterium]|jgi:ribosomal protein S18 acetylase RimI-like enzyme|nr:GNAT family N-acetyltransferase [Dysgonamonadaceae bacterium]